jgi:hypothetical protein
MHSNLSTYEEVIAMANLPERIRPTWLAFGTLADGFLPFFRSSPDEGIATTKAGDASVENNANATGQGQALGRACPLNSRLEVRLCSVVMKAVQARHPAVAAWEVNGESAGKLGDGAAEAILAGTRGTDGGTGTGEGLPEDKAQVDWRLDADGRRRTRARMAALALGRKDIDADRASVALAEAYGEVCAGLLN